MLPEDSGDKWNLVFGPKAEVDQKMDKIFIQWDLDIRRTKVIGLINIWLNLKWKHSLGTVGQAGIKLPPPLG